eukprot:15294036-Heterocapsa_arctica.AAC.1
MRRLGCLLWAVVDEGAQEVHAPAQVVQDVVARVRVQLHPLVQAARQFHVALEGLPQVEQSCPPIGQAAICRSIRQPECDGHSSIQDGRLGRDGLVVDGVDGLV